MPRPLPDQGWERRFVADANRAREAVALYQAAGFEVRTVPAGPEDFDTGCEPCELVQRGAFQVIYTRRAAQAAMPSEES
jgi:hypothetical protein